MLAHVVPMDARPFGAALLTVWLILPGTPRTPARSALFFSRGEKNNFSQAQKQPPKPKADTPPPARATTGDFKGKFDWRGTWKTRDGNGTPMVIQRVYLTARPGAPGQQYNGVFLGIFD
jgi:hypothetical protein